VLLELEALKVHINETIGKVGITETDDTNLIMSALRQW